MVQVDGRCRCTTEGCSCFENPSPYSVWVDVLSGMCRSCEDVHAVGMTKRWGPKRDEPPAEDVTEIKLKVEDEPDVRNEHEVKQVILIRRDLGMRRGKEIAQGSHASIAFLTNVLHEMLDCEAEDELCYPTSEYITEAQRQWIDGQFTKVTLQIHSEDELLRYYEKAIEAGLTAHLIKDSGRTEFGGEPTYTTCAIGPDWSDDIDKVTADLKLY